VDSIPKEVRAHYEAGQESERLRAGQGELERLRTQAILARELPAAPATVYDVGGGAGVYAIPLAAAGYQVHLIDPVELHLDQAREAAAAAGVRLASIERGDARKLEAKAATADAVLLLGPLYHLTDRGDRMEAIAESRRVLKPGGVMVAAGISRFASLIDGVAQGFFRDEAFRQIVAGDLESGQHRNPVGHPRYFTTAYFHRPDELVAEVREGGFGDVVVVGVEGPVWSAGRFEETWSDPVQRARLMEFLSTVEREESILGASAHFLAVARGPR